MPKLLNPPLQQQRVPKALLIPEVLDHIAFQFSTKEPHNIYRCILVCQAWHTIFLPYLYRTTDDSLRCWYTFLAVPRWQSMTKLVLEEECKRRSDTALAIFVKHGHLIRHLTTHVYCFNNFASASRSCTGLVSLVSRENYNYPVLEDKHPILWYPPMALLGSAPQVRPMPEQLGLRSERYWVWCQWQWHLLRQNVATLEDLNLGRFPNNWTSNLDDAISFFEACPRLRRLIISWSEIPLSILVQRVTQLREYTCRYLRPHDLFCLLTELTPVSQLTVLRIAQKITQLEVMSILKFIPNLEELWLEDQHGDYFTRHLPSPQSPLKTRLKILYLIPFRPYNPNYCMIVGILPHAPELLEIGLPYLNHEIATDISTFCPRLQTFIQTNTSESSHSSELPCGIINSLGILLSNCPNLKKIDGSNHQIGAQFLLTHPWICQRLEVLRCRIVGVDRLSEEEEIDYHQGLLLRRLGWPLPEAETLAVEKYIHQICPQHQQIYAQLAKMTHLRVLEIGMEYRNLSHEKNFRFHPVSFIHRGAQTYIDYGPPPQNTLELSLTSGLEQLSTLRNLKVFGFEGVDCRIDEEELRWMAIAWPKLRVMRGLQDIEARFPNSIYDGERWYRRWFMRMLRPNVKHEHRLVEPICFVWQHKY